MVFECWNVRCPNYAGAGVQMGEAEVHHGAPARPQCPACGAFVRAVFADRNFVHARSEPPSLLAMLAPVFGGAVLAGALLGPEARPLGAVAVLALLWLWPG